MDLYKGVKSKASLQDLSAHIGHTDTTSTSFSTQEGENSASCFPSLLVHVNQKVLQK